MKRRNKKTLSQKRLHFGQSSTAQQTDLDKILNKEFDKLSKGEMEEVVLVVI